MAVSVFRLFQPLIPLQPPFSGLEFTAAGLSRNMDNKSEEISVSFSKAYEETLMKYHGILVRPIFHV